MNMANLDCFTNRRKEIECFSNFLTEGKHINIYGAIGIGKTSFSYYFLNTIKDTFFPIIIEIAPCNNLQELLKTIAIQTNNALSTERPFSTFLQRINEIHDSEKIRELFCSGLDVLEYQKRIIFFDNKEKINLKIWKEFEKKILSDYVGTCDKSNSNLKIITAGYRSRQWYGFPMKKQVRPCRLKLFDKASTDEMVLKLSEHHNFEVKNEKTALAIVYQLTQGHPECINIVIKLWTADYNLPLNGNDIKFRYGHGVQALVKDFIEPRITHQVNGLERNEDYPPSKNLFTFLQHLVPLRFVSSQILREALRQLFPNFYQDKRSRFFSKLFKKLQQDNIIDKSDLTGFHKLLQHNNITEKGTLGDVYEFSGITRHVLLENFKRNDAEKLINLHKGMAKIYQEQLEEEHINWTQNLIERLYHIISWQKLENDNETNNNFHDIYNNTQTEIDKYAEKYKRETSLIKKLLKKDNGLNDVYHLKFKSIFSR